MYVFQCDSVTIQAVLPLILKGYLSLYSYKQNCPGVHKVRVGPATRSVVASSFIQLIYFTVHTIHYTSQYSQLPFLCSAVSTWLSSVLDNYNSQSPKIEPRSQPQAYWHMANYLWGQSTVRSLTGTGNHWSYSLKLRMASVRPTIHWQSELFSLFYFKLNPSAKWEEAVDSNLAAVGHAIMW